MNAIESSNGRGIGQARKRCFAGIPVRRHMGVGRAMMGLILVLVPSLAGATGLGNLTYTAAELEKPIANFGATGTGKFPAGPPGSNTVLMLRDVLLIPGSNDSGKPPLSLDKTPNGMRAWTAAIESPYERGFGAQRWTSSPRR